MSIRITKAKNKSGQMKWIIRIKGTLAQEKFLFLSCRKKVSFTCNVSGFFSFVIKNECVTTRITQSYSRRTIITKTNLLRKHCPRDSYISFSIWYGISYLRASVIEQLILMMHTLTVNWLTTNVKFVFKALNSINFFHIQK